MIFMLELHTLRPLHIDIDATGIVLQLFFLSFSAQATTFSEQVDFHRKEAAAKLASRIMNDIRDNGGEILLSDVTQALQVAYEHREASRKEVV